jgi:hypothetical protein
MCEVGEPEGVIGQKTLELDFFAGALRRIGESWPEERQNWRDGIYTEIRGWMRVESRNHESPRRVDG